MLPQVKFRNILIYDNHLTDYLAPSDNPNGTKSESEPENVAVSNRPNPFLLSTNVDVGISPTYHTSTHRPNLEDGASSVPISGSGTLGSNTDYMGAQIVQDTQFPTPEKPPIKAVSHDRDEVFNIYEIRGRSCCDTCLVK